MATPKPKRATSRARVAPAAADDRRRQPRGAQRRQQILDAAADLLAERGARGTDVATIAAKVGMTAPGLLYYFGTKERLLLEVVEERYRQREIHPTQRMTLKELRDHARFNAEHPLLTRLNAVLTAESFDTGAPLHEFFARRAEEARAFLREALSASVEDGQLRDDVDVDALATEIHATSAGLEVQWLLDPTRVDLGRSLETYLDRLLELLAPPA